MEDISISLFEELKKEFEKRYDSNESIQTLIRQIDEGANYRIANQYALEVGDLLADVLREKISSNILPQGKMFYNIATKTIEPMLENNYKLISKECEKIQKYLNEVSNLGMNVVVPKINQDRVDGLIDIISGPDKYDDIKYVLDESIPNFSQSIVDDTIHENARFQYDAGLSPKITRVATGKCCKWCSNLAGTYDYADVKDTGNDVFRRHRSCRCIVTYHPINGKVKNVHTKKTLSKQQLDDLETRKTYGLKGEFTKSKANPYAKQLIATAKEKEVFVTSSLKNSVSKGSGQLVGLDYRIKSEESLTRKIETKSTQKNISFETYSKNVTDVLRYTNVSDGKYLADDYTIIVEDMRKKGYNLIESTNTFPTQSPYKGINCLVQDKEGFVFELQFHTPQSLEIKEVNHKLYEEARQLDISKEKKEALFNQMTSNSDRIEVPNNIADIQDIRKE